MAKTLSNIGALWKQGWNEIPEVMGASIFGMIGLVMGVYIVEKYKRNPNNTKRYKMYYTIMRPDDKKVEKLWRFDNSPPYTTGSTVQGGKFLK